MGFALDCLNTFVTAVVIYQPSLEATAIMGWFAELFIRGQILMPPAPGVLGNPVNTAPCGEHVLRVFHPAVQLAGQNRTLALLQEGAAATALLNERLSKEREERSSKEAAREASKARESSRAAGAAPSRRAKADPPASRSKEAKCYYADDAEKDTVVDYAKVCPLHGPGHKAAQCNVLLKSKGGKAETLNPRYKDVKYPLDGKSYAALSKCE
jgi:hypothetical protein